METVKTADYGYVQLYGYWSYSCDCGLGLWPKLYVDTVYDDNTAEVTNVALYQRNLRVTFTQKIPGVCVCVCVCVCKNLICIRI